MNILIIGGAGFVGYNLADFFSRNHSVIVMDNLVRRGSEYNLSKLNDKGIEFIHGDIRNPEDFLKLPCDIDFVLECSAQPTAIDGYKNPVFDLTNNTVGVLNVLEFCRKNGCALIFWSTNKVYSGEKLNKLSVIEKDTRLEWDSNEKCDVVRHGVPEDFPIDGGNHTIYGISKLCADLMCQEWSSAFGIKVVVNRFSCLAGSNQYGMVGQGWLAWWVIAGLLDIELNYIGWRGKQVRDCLFIEDVCDLIDKEMMNIDTINGEVFNIGGGVYNTMSLVETTNLVSELISKEIKVKHINEPRKADQKIYISDIRKAKKVLDWSPTISVKEGLSSIVDWVRCEEGVIRSLNGV